MMEIATTPYAYRPETDRLYFQYLDGLALLFLDIETTGLNPQTAELILVGCGIVDPAAPFSMEQSFCSSPEDEPAVLERLRDLLELADVVVTYNGNRFDLPFFETRLRAHGYPSAPTVFQKLDLYRMVDRYTSLRQFLPNLRQKTMEHFLGIAGRRTDQISGAESVELYRRWLLHRRDADRNAILLHNADDVRQLGRLLPLLNRLDPHRAFFHEGFLIRQGDRRLLTEAIGFGQRSLIVSGRTRRVFSDWDSFSYGCRIRHRTADAALHLELPLEQVHAHLVADLDALPIDADALTELPEYASGYLILRDPAGTRYGAVNRLVRAMGEYVLASFALSSAPPGPDVL